MFVAETTGRPSFVVPGLIAAVAAELVMGTSSVTKYQRTPTTRTDDDDVVVEDGRRPDDRAGPALVRRTDPFHGLCG